MYPSLLKEPSEEIRLPSSEKDNPDKSTFSLMAGGTGEKLAQEITEEFLVCKICLEPYKTPKCLTCLHTFCETCIESHISAETTYKKYSDYREFTCPLCRKRTQLPIGGVKKLADNFLVASLTEMVDRQKPSKYPFCDICKQIHRRHREAASKCLDCSKLLCKACVEIHKDTRVTQNHSIFDVEIEKDIECKEHPEEVVRFYCEPCEACICVLCTFNEHKDHEVSQFQEAVLKYKESIGDLLDGCQDKIDMLESQLDTVATCETIINEAEQKIHDTAIDFISEIRNREKLLIEELHTMYGPQTMEMIKTRGDMKANVEGLKSTCNLTEIILKGKDIELLLLKKQVKEKLGGLSDLDIKTLPSTIAKEVRFVPGQIDIGYIHDKDRPLLSKLRAKKAQSTGQWSGEISEDELIAERATQTENEISHEESMTDELECEDEEIQTEDDLKDETAAEETDEEDLSNWYEKGKTDRGCQTEFETGEKAVNTRARERGMSASRSIDDTADVAVRRRRRERANTSALTDNTQPADNSYPERSSWRRSVYGTTGVSEAPSSTYGSYYPHSNYY